MNRAQPKGCWAGPAGGGGEEEEKVCLQPAGFVTCCLQRSWLPLSPIPYPTPLPPEHCSVGGKYQPKEEENTGLEGVPRLLLLPAAPVTHLLLKIQVLH